MNRFLAGWGREEQGCILIVLNILLPSFSTGLYATSYRAENHAIVHAIECYIPRFLSCGYQFFVLSSDSQSVMTTLPVPLSYLTNHQSVPGHSLPDNDVADGFAKVDPLLPSTIPLSLSPLISSPVYPSIPPLPHYPGSLVLP